MGRAPHQESKQEPGIRAQPTRRGQPPSDATPPSLIEAYGRDIAGVGLVVFGIVGSLGVYFDASGPFGSAVSAAFEVLVGLLSWVAPVLCIGAGGLLISHRFGQGPAPTTDTGHPERRQRAARRGFGAIVTVLGLTALLHVARVGGDRAGFDWGELRRAGGLAGALLGVPLRGLLGVPGTVLVSLAMIVLGASFSTGRPVKELWGVLARGVSHVGQSMWRSVSKLFQVGDQQDDAGANAARTFFDYDIDGTSPAPTVTRSKGSGQKTQPHQPQSDSTVVFPQVSAITQAEQLSIDLEPRRVGDWMLPPLSLLARSPEGKVDQEAISQRGRELEHALAEHGVATRLVGMIPGPTVTRYELELGVGVKVNQVVNLSKDIAYAMASPDVRIIAPIPGKQAIGVEVPNRQRQIVALGDILCSSEARRAHGSLSVAVGRDIEGRAVMVDLAKMPHILIAGQTGAGKSSCINSIMTSVLLRSTPDEVRLILVDPKRVELTQYNRVPHLLTQVVTDPKKAANALAWAVAEMERRYELLEEVGARDIGGYNDRFDAGELHPPLGTDREYSRLPLILIVVDELADLMMVAARDVEESINRIAAKARAVGIHLVIATQRPSVNVITGVIKANIPARFAFAVASATDSKVIMNTGGAERLVGQGDMLFLSPTSSAADRIQGCWVGENEVAAVVTAWRDQAPEIVDDHQVQVEANLAAAGMPSAVEAHRDDDDELLPQALELVVRSQLGSTSMLQRKLKVGFSRAGRLMDMLEERGVVGPSEGAKARTVLVSVEEYEASQSSGWGQPTEIHTGAE